MSAEPVYRMDILTGYIRFEQRTVPCGDGSVAWQSRCLTYTDDHRLHERGPWETTSIMRFE